jgi:phosphodiesterase/alkaline phosphatase D-like protein
MNKLFLILAIAAVSGSAPFQQRAVAQIPPPAKRTTHVQITEGPAPETARDTWAIIRWTSDNPGGMDEHFGVVHYGTDPKDLSQTAKGHIRLNRNHTYTVFRVSLDGLKPGTTYYYTVGSMGAGGADDGVKSTVAQFTTAASPGGQQAAK